MAARKIKIGVIGGGSVFTPELIKLLAEITSETGPMEVYLMDIMPKRLNTVADMCRRMVAKSDGAISISTTLDSAEAIQGADYICNQIRSGGLPARIEDEHLGRKYKLPFTETVSVCGFATYLRSFPDIVHLADQIRALSPDAWVLNFANPAGMLSETFYRLGVKKIVGVCNVSEKIKDFIAERLNISRDDMYMNWRGLNHMTFFDKVIVNGKDQFRKVIENYDKGESTLPFPKELIQDLDLIPNLYLQYYFLKDQLIEKLQAQEQNRSELVLEIEKQLLALFETADDIPELLKMRGGYGYSRVVVGFIRDLITGGGRVHYGIVRNGSTLEDIPADGFVEVPVLVNKNRVEALQVDPLPLVVRPVVISLKAYEDMLIEASFTKDKNLLLQALLMHPLISTYDLSKSLLDDVLRVNAPNLGWMKS